MYTLQDIPLNFDEWRVNGYYGHHVPQILKCMNCNTGKNKSIRFIGIIHAIWGPSISIYGIMENECC
jgi:hypothetical protein